MLHVAIAIDRASRVSRNHFRLTRPHQLAVQSLQLRALFQQIHCAKSGIGGECQVVTLVGAGGIIVTVFSWVAGIVRLLLNLPAIISSF